MFGYIGKLIADTASSAVAAIRGNRPTLPEISPAERINARLLAEYGDTFKCIPGYESIKVHEVPFSASNRLPFKVVLTIASNTNLSDWNMPVQVGGIALEIQRSSKVINQVKQVPQNREFVSEEVLWQKLCKPFQVAADLPAPIKELFSSISYSESISHKLPGSELRIGIASFEALQKVTLPKTVRNFELKIDLCGPSEACANELELAAKPEMENNARANSVPRLSSQAM